MSQRIVAVASIPAAGPYSQAVEAGNLVFCSGQLPIDPETGKMVTGDIGTATEQVLKNIRTVLAAAGLDLSHVVKTTVYLVDIGDFPAVNAVYGRYFAQNFPARSTVQVAGLPRGVAVEMDAIAVRP